MVLEPGDKVLPVCLQNTILSTARQHPLKIRTLRDYVEVLMGNHVDEAGEIIILHLPQILILRYVIVNTQANNTAS